MSSLIRDLRYSIRLLRRAPAFAVLLILTLALGVASLASVFSVVSTVLLKPLPYEEPDRLVTIQSMHPEQGVNQVTEAPFFAAMCREAHRVEKLNAAAAATVWMETDGVGRSVEGASATPGLFDLLGVRPALGRSFNEADGRPGGPPKALVAHSLWVSAFGSDPGIVGRSVRFSGEGLPGLPGEGLVTVVGVLPDGFRAPFPNLQPQIWFASALDKIQGRDAPWVVVFGRLAPGTGAGAAESELQTIYERFHRATRGGPPEWRIRALSLRDFFAGDLRRPLLYLFLGGLLVLGIAGTNASALVLSRSSRRTGEVALRATLGARRRHLLRQLVAEGAVPALLAGAVGLALAWSGLRIFVRLGLPGLPSRFRPGLDWRVVSIVGVATLLLAAALALAPGWRLSRVRPAHALSGLHGPSLFRRERPRPGRFMLLAFQVAFAVVVAVGCVHLVEGYLRLLRTDPGFQPDGLLTAQISIPETVASTGRARDLLFRRVIHRVEEIPGAAEVALTSYLPLGGESAAMAIEIDGARGEAPEPLQIQTRAVSPRYLETMGISLIEGRAFRQGDLYQPAVILSRRAARWLWGDRDPLGRRVRLAGSDRNPWMSVVGVAQDVRHDSLRAEPQATMYFPYISQPSMALAVRTAAGKPEILGSAVRDAVRGIDPRLPVMDVATMKERISADLGTNSLGAWLMAVLATIAVLLAGVGVYGAAWQAISERRGELGIRYALGATRRGLTWHLGERTLTSVGAGLLGGVAMSLAGDRILASLVSDLTAESSWTAQSLLTSSVLFLVVTVVGAVIPAWRASATDPTRAIKS